MVNYAHNLNKLNLLSKSYYQNVHFILIDIYLFIYFKIKKYGIYIYIYMFKFISNVFYEPFLR